MKCGKCGIITRTFDSFRSISLAANSGSVIAGLERLTACALGLVASAGWRC